MGVARFAERLAERHQLAIPGFPVAFWQNPAQFHFRFEWCLCFDKAKAVGNAVDVDIDTDAVLIERDGNNEICCLSPDPRELAELVDRFGDASREFLVENVGKGFEVFSFDAIEADRKK